jgi:hypothetical protein
MQAVALLLAVALALPATRGKDDEAITVKLITISANDSQNDVEGTIAVKSFTVKGKHGTMEIPAGKVGSIGHASIITDEGKIMVVSTTDEQRFSGVITSPKTLEVAGKYGRFSTSWDDVHELKVVGARELPDEDEDDDVPAAWSVRIETERGDRTAGPLYHVSDGPIRSVDIECEFGSLSIDADQIRSIQFDAAPKKATEDEDESPPPGRRGRRSRRIDPEDEESLGMPVQAAPGPPMVGVDTWKAGSIVTVDGGKLAGTITIPAGWVVETNLGFLGLKADKLKSITFEGPAKLPDPQPPRPAPTPKPTPTPSVESSPAPVGSTPEGPSR